MVSDDDMHRNSKFFQSIDKDVLEAVQGNVVNKLTTINNVAKMKLRTACYHHERPSVYL
jgi:hypothetical protein